MKIEDKFSPEFWQDINNVSDEDDLKAVKSKINELIDHTNKLSKLVIGIE